MNLRLFSINSAKPHHLNKKAFQDTLVLFLTEPDYPSLRNQVLKDKYTGVRSIDVTEDWRALYRIERDRIIFVEIGTHDQLYG